MSNLITIFSKIKLNTCRLTHFTSNIRSFQTLKSPLWQPRNTVFTGKLNLPTFQIRFNSFITQLRQKHQETFKNIDTNVSNNVLLWKNMNLTYTMKLGIFCSIQTVILLFASWAIYSQLPNKDKYNSITEYFQDNMLLLLTMVLPLIVVAVTIFSWWAFTVRSFKYIILNKGGQNVTLVTYHPIKGTRQLIVPVQNVNLKKSRQELSTYIPVKVKDHKFYFLIDKDGSFVNPQLFDYTIGVSESNK